ncbi:MAG: phosphoadenylyl-sulfate reductase [Solirubrobacterales bacterium]
MASEPPLAGHPEPAAERSLPQVVDRNFGGPAIVDDLEGLGAQEVIAEALDRWHPSLTFACSFQKEEAVILHMATEVRPDIKVFALDTEVLFEETYETWKAFEERFGIAIEPYRGITLGEQAERYGEALWTREPDRCCGLRKIEPLGRALAGQDAWVTGIRRDQAPTRANARKLEWDAGHDLHKLNPLADWTERDVWTWIAKHDLPYNPLHDAGYSSIGCVHCTLPGEGREGRWAGSGKLECGLHRAGS